MSVTSTCSVTDLVRSILTEGREQVAAWVPDPEGPFFGTGAGSSTASIPPDFVVDDGNLLVAVLRVELSQEQAMRGDGWAREANRRIDLTANLLVRAIRDVGLHRLLVVLVALDASSEDGHLHQKLREALRSNQKAVRQYRALVLPGNLDEDDQCIRARLRRTLEVVLPLDVAPFLREPEDKEAATVLDKAMPVDESPARIAFREDVRGFLAQGDWEGGVPWSRTIDALEREICTASEAEEASHE